MAASDHRHDSRNYFRRIVALPCAQSRIDGERVDPGGRAFNHHLSRLRRSFFGRATRQFCKTTSFKPQGRRASRSRSAWA